MSGRKLGAVLWFYRLGRLLVIMLVYVLEFALVFNHLFLILIILMSRTITTDPVIFAVLGRTCSILRSRSSILVRYVLLRLCKITYSFNSAHGSIFTKQFNNYLVTSPIHSGVMHLYLTTKTGRFGDYCKAATSCLILIYSC